MALSGAAVCGLTWKPRRSFASKAWSAVPACPRPRSTRRYPPGNFRSPSSFGKRSSAWIDEEIDEWQAARIADRDGGGGPQRDLPSGVILGSTIQSGADVETIRKALPRDSYGRASGPLRAALDRLADDEL